jgi:hypothetical protein
VRNRIPSSDQAKTFTERSLSGDHQHTPHSGTTAVPSCSERQRKDEDSPRPIYCSSKVCSKRSPDVYKVGKFYVGLLKELPPPSLVQGEWDKDIRPMLEIHLCQATNMLPKSMRDEDLITEPVLCMAGRKCSPTSVLSQPGATCLEDPVLLKPTVWIHCGSKKCKKKVLDAVRQLSYLNHFLSKLNMEPPHVSLHAPWPAAEEHPSQSPRPTGNSNQVSFAIQDSTFTWKTIYGAKARYTFRTSQGIVERYSTVGGLVVVKNSLFAITTAHTIVNCSVESCSRVPIHDMELTSDSSSDTGSDCDMNSDTEADASTVDPYPLPASRTCARRSSVDSREPQETMKGTWKDSKLPNILAYMNRGTIDGDYSFPILAPSTSDFALMDPESVLQLSNEYYDQDSDTIETISGHITTCELLSGDVWIITSCGTVPQKGYMLEGDASIILKGTIMRTKKIQVAFISGMFISRID